MNPPTTTDATFDEGHRHTFDQRFIETSGINGVNCVIERKIDADKGVVYKNHFPG